MAKGKHEAPSPRRMGRAAATASVHESRHAAPPSRAPRRQSREYPQMPAVETVRRHSAPRAESPRRAPTAPAAPRRRSVKKTFLTIAAALMLIVTVMVGGTLAFLVANTQDVVNVFEPTDVKCNVNDNGSVTNTGSIDAYIRVAVVQNYVNSSGHVCAEHTQPVNPPAPDGWTLRDGYYYYNTAVIPSGSTSVITGFDSAQDSTNPDGCTLKVELFASAIQAQPAEASRSAWGYTPGT